MSGRWLKVAIIVLAVAQCFFWVAGAWIGQSVGPWITPAPLANALIVGAVLNVAALALYLSRQSPLGEWVLAAVQGVNLAFSLVASVLVSAAWLPLSMAPALATLVLIFLRHRSTSAVRTL